MRCAVTVYPTVKFSSDTQEEIAFIMTDITNYVDQSIADFITGVTDIDAEWGIPSRL